MNSAREQGRRRGRDRGRDRRPPVRRGRDTRSSGGGLRERVAQLSVPARWGLGVPLGLLALAIVIVLGDVAVSYGRIHPGVRVADVALGGMTREAAARQMDRELGRRLRLPVTATYKTGKWNANAAQLGLTLDATLTADAAMKVGREPTLAAAVARRFAAVFGGVEVTATLDADDASLTSLFDKIDETVAVPARDATVKLEGLEGTLVPSADGVRLDRRAATDGLMRTFVSNDRTLSLRLQRVPVRITDAEARDAIAQTKKLLSGPVTIRWEDKSWSFEPNVMAEWITYRQVVKGTTNAAEETSAAAGVSVAASATPKAQQIVLLATFAGDAVSRTITPMTGVIGRPAVNAEFVVSGGGVSIKASQTGLGPDIDALVSDMERTLKQSVPREVTLRLAAVEPELTTEKAREMGIKERISTYTTSYNASQAPRVNNIHTLADALNNKLVPPGGVFDFNATVGERTAAKGYQVAPGIVDGKLVPQYGGGICQIGTTFFNTVFFSGLPVLERKNHSFYISHYPKGRDCTVTWNGPNLRWKNDTDSWILIKTSYTGGSVTVSLYGTAPGYSVTYTTSDFSNIRPRPIVERPDPTLRAGARVVEDAGEDGKTCTVVRTVTKGGIVVRTDTFVSNYKPKEETVRVGTKTPPSTPTSPAP